MGCSGSGARSTCPPPRRQGHRFPLGPVDERSEERRIVQQHIDPGQFGRKLAELVRQDRFPQRRLISYGAQHEWSQALLVQGFETILPCQSHIQRPARLDFFRAE